VSSVWLFISTVPHPISAGGHTNKNAVPWLVDTAKNAVPWLIDTAKNAVPWLIDC